MAKKKILICDDEKNIQESIKLILEKEPYALYFADSGPEVIEKAASLKPDLILLDIKMPKLSGLDVLPEIKTISPNTKIIIISGYEDTGVIKEALKRGATDYLAKSFSGKDLRETISSVLNK